MKFLFCIFETGSFCIARGGFELLISLTTASQVLVAQVRTTMPGLERLLSTSVRPQNLFHEETEGGQGRNLRERVRPHRRGHGCDLPFIFLLLLCFFLLENFF